MYDPILPEDTRHDSATDGTALSDLLGSRICHDLISPLGAIANGVELLSLAGHADIPEISLIAESVEAANARIRFFRIAFGHADHHATLSGGEIREILGALVRLGRTRITWAPDGPVPRPEAKLAFLMILCAETSMPRGGSLVIGKEDGRWRIAARGPSPKLTSSLWGAFTGPVTLDDTSPGDAHFPLAARWALALGRTVELSPGEDGFDVSF